MPDDARPKPVSDIHGEQPGDSNAPADTSGGGLGDGPAKRVIPGGDEMPKPSTPLILVDQMPQFVGDMNAYIASHIHYPDAAREAGIGGKVVIRFVVNEDGSVSDIVVGRGIGYGCDAEALQMVRDMPKWKPGKQKGVPVKVYFTLPVKFELN